MNRTDKLILASLIVFILSTLIVIGVTAVKIQKTHKCWDLAIGGTLKIATVCEERK